ncbi:Structural maintenance of chromosomes protein 6 [Orbilia oligospora]|uniref:Structural maintenance of chromosomes protein 6 n=1 Tax=Orbilia oligospora TaxID=2813651 RepID=A0A7C8Q9I4_ORBOL|nr:Structural maintenance of chromosomes protein 6 [Orbilia oligospora]
MFTKRPRSKTQSETVSDLQGFTSDGIQFNKKRKTTGSNANLKEDNADIDSDEEALYFEQSQLMAANNIAPRGNEPADYGTIELIRLENFMCHPCLEMKFGPFMNFVVGQNGSGKSAVLTALTLCLGAKAAVTNRGGNVKSFIKEGEHMAVVEVHLRNRGDGFRKDVYGETIIIQRTFNRDGVTSYKIKAKSGKVVSTAKKELSDIIDYMSLQVDNPMTVLSQDLARQFLSNSTDEDKYKFFMKGVQLDDLYALYQALKSQQAQIDGVLESKAEDIRELKEDKEAAEKKFKLVQQTDDLRNNVTELLLTHAWAQVSESKLCLETANKKLSDSQRTKEELNMKLENANITVKTWDQKVSQALEAVENSSDSINPLKDEKKELEGRLLSNRKNFEQIQLEERSIYDHLKTAKRNLEKAQHDVDTEKQRLADADNGKLTSLVEEKERLLEERGRLELEINGLDENINVEQNINRENKAKLDELRDKVQKKEASVRGAKDALKQLTSSHSGNLNLYGQNIPKLIEAIGRTSWKAEKPIGPIGLFVKLKDKKWSSIVERQLGRVLTGFITSSLEDKDRLMSLTREYKCANTVYYTSRASFQLKEPSSEYLTVLRALEIEQTILVEDHMEGRRIMEKSPENVKFCYSINKNKRGNGFSIKMGQGSGGVDPIIGWTQAPRMATSIEEQIKFAEASIAVKDSELGEARDKYTDLEDAISAYQDSLVERRNHKQRNKTEIQRIDDQIEDITQKLEQDNSNTELIRLEAAVETQKHAYVISTGQHNDNLAEKQRLSRIQTELDAEMKDLSAKIDEFETHADSLQNIHNLAIQQKEASVLASAEILRKIEIQDAEISELSNSAEKAEEHLGGQIVEAQKVGAEVRLGADDTTKKIETQLNQLEAEIRKRDARIGASTESIAKDYRTKTEKYKAAREEVTDLEKVHQALQQTFEERMERWGYFRKYISVQSRYQFRFLMSEREFDGKLAFDHKKGILQLRVQPSQQATDTQRNTKTLSGGEKSFSQICLLLALWEAMGSPFRCLDEFDVFMDAVNRGVSMGLIIKAARNSVGKQFILITPQDVSTKGIDETADVRIVRMPDPQRNQTRIQVRR